MSSQAYVSRRDQERIDTSVEKALEYHRHRALEGDKQFPACLMCGTQSYAGCCRSCWEGQ